MTREDRVKIKQALDADARARVARVRAAEERIRDENFELFRLERRRLTVAALIVEGQGQCSGCGCDYTSHTEGCQVCKWRHRNYGRRQQNVARGRAAA